MTTSLSLESTTAPRWRYFIRHGVEMFVAMIVGMALLAPIWEAGLGLVGLAGALTRPDLAAFVAATDMTVAMTVWMAYRGHGRSRLIEMAAAMYLPFLVLLVPYWLGVLPGEHVTMGGHVLMVPAMAIAMFAHRDEYSHRHGTGHHVHPLIGVLGRRAATWIALAITVDNFTDPLAPAPWALLLLPSAYLLFGGVRGHLRDPRQLALQLAGFALYLVLMVVAANAEPRTADWIVAIGFGLHALWDLAYHRANVVAPRWWAEWCGVVDAVIAITFVVSAL